MLSASLHTPGIEQRAIVICAHSKRSCLADEDRLNDRLSEGWQVASVTSVGAGGGGDFEIAFLVVLERRRLTEQKP